MWELISNYIGTLILNFVAIIFGKYILKEKFKINKLFVLFIIIFATLIMRILHMIDYPLLRTVTGFLYCLVVFKYVFGISEGKSILATIIYYILMFCGEMLFFIIITLLFKTSGNAAYIEFGGDLFINIIVSILSIIISYLFRNLIVKLMVKNIKNSLIVYWCLN